MDEVTTLEHGIKKWIKYNRSKQFDDELNNVLEAGDTEKQKQLFLSRLKFGTAGIRGAMGPGFSQMNDVVIIQTGQGLVQYVLQNQPLVRNTGIAVGYDGRHHSKRFAELTATIIASEGIPVYLFSQMVPTPFIPTIIGFFGLAAGVMITASHNPKEDNGYKVYWDNGAQIINPHDKGIQKCILENLEPLGSSWDTKMLESCTLVQDPLLAISEAYNRALVLSAFDLNMNSSSDVIFTYTPLHGVGYQYVSSVAKDLKLKNLVPVEAQKDPDPEFPTVKFPNPEEGKSALELSFQTADNNNSRIILANDPDADRLGVAEKNPKTGEWKIFTGNELGALLGWWLIHVQKTKHPEDSLKDHYILSTVVSSQIVKTIAELEGINYEETLTGFKWIGNRIWDLLNNSKKVLFAFEEAIGFLCNPSIRDKDGISAFAKVAELVIYLNTINMTLTDKLEDIYNKYGYHITENSYFFCYDPSTIKKIFEMLRNYDGTTNINNYPDGILQGRYKITAVRDLTTGYDSSMEHKKANLPVSSSNQMITFTFENGFICTLRASGTEPKVKYYCELRGSGIKQNVKVLRATLNEMIHSIIEEFLQPGANYLVAKK